MAEQAKKLMQMIGVAVDKLNDLETLGPVLQDLARRHVDYGVQESHYQTVGAALLKPLEQGLGEYLAPSVKDAWTSAYGVMGDVMFAGARS
jgi:hemoglobin-like flavoprotein